MGAPKGNEFWKLRSKHGSDKLFKSPELLWEACCEYFQWCIDNPLIEVQYVGKDAHRVEVPKTRVYTIQGVCHYLGVNVDYLTDMNDRLKDKEDEISKEFTRIITHVREIIYKQKFEYATAGLFSATFISRDLGMTDKKDVTINSEQGLFGPLDNDKKK